jgi:hypothetical protein
MGDLIEREAVLNAIDKAQRRFPVEGPFKPIADLTSEITKLPIHNPTCQRTITEKDWTGHYKRKCGKPATRQQDDGLPLCEGHHRRWMEKQSNHNPWNHPTVLPDEGRMCVFEWENLTWLVGQARIKGYEIPRFVLQDESSTFHSYAISSCKRWRYLDE